MQLSVIEKWPITNKKNCYHTRNCSIAWNDKDLTFVLLETSGVYHHTKPFSCLFLLLAHIWKEQWQKSIITICWVIIFSTLVNLYPTAVSRERLVNWVKWTSKTWFYKLPAAGLIKFEFLKNNKNLTIFQTFEKITFVKFVKKLKFSSNK